MLVYVHQIRICERCHRQKLTLKCQRHYHKAKIAEQQVGEKGRAYYIQKTQASTKRKNSQIYATLQTTNIRPLRTKASQFSKISMGGRNFSFIYF